MFRSPTVKSHPKPVISSDSKEGLVSKTVLGSEVRCFLCEKKGHIKRNCQQLAKSRKPIAVVRKLGTDQGTVESLLRNHVSTANVSSPNELTSSKRACALRDMGAAQLLILRDALPSRFQC